jgi:2'-5' RNA ligase
VRHPDPGQRSQGPNASAARPSAPRDASLRLFVALDLPEAAVAAVSTWQDLVFGHLPELRINRALHLTLCFLGNTPASAVAPLTRALASVRFPRFTLAFGEPVFLPERGRKNVVALPLVDAASSPGGLAAVCHLQTEVSAALAATGFYHPERRAYLPHVTVARFRRPGHPFSLHNVNLPELCPSDLVLYTSTLERSGAVHTPLAKFTPSQALP